MSTKKTIFSLIFISSLCFFNLISCQKKPAPQLQERYVITSPELAEIVSVIAGTENIVGVTAECNYPQELKKITKVGTFGKIDLEKLLALEPTMVFVAGLEQDEIAYQLQKVGIPIISIYPSSIADLQEAIQDIGLALNEENKADSLNYHLQKVIASHQKDLPENSPSIYVEIYGNPLMSVSDSSYIGELVELAGADNIFSQLPRAYSRIKPEKVLEYDPEIILLTYPGVTALDVKKRMGWEVISACKNDRIYNIEDIDPDLILRAGPRLPKALEVLKGII